MDFDKMQESRAQLQDLFRTFMLKSKESFNDEEKKRKFNDLQIFRFNINLQVLSSYVRQIH